MSPDVVLATLARLGGSVGRVVIVGCQPADLREGMGLTPAVQDAVDAAVDLCLEVVADDCPCPAADVLAAEPAGTGGRHPRLDAESDALFASLLLAVVAGLVIKSLPDIARYLKMREM